jgi:hypothetical protein
VVNDENALGKETVMDELSQRARNAVDRCPHCGNSTGLEITAALRYRCRICGGPRVPIAAEHRARTNREADQLGQAKRAHRAQWLYAALAVASFIVGGVSFIATFLTLLAVSSVATAWSTLLLLPGLTLIVALWARRRSTKAAERRGEALDAAWASVLHELLAIQSDEMTSAQLADQLLTDEPHVDHLLARLSVEVGFFTENYDVKHGCTSFFAARHVSYRYLTGASPPVKYRLFKIISPAV